MWLRGRDLNPRPPGYEGYSGNQGISMLPRCIILGASGHKVSGSSPLAPTWPKIHRISVGVNWGMIYAISHGANKISNYLLHHLSTIVFSRDLLSEMNQIFSDHLRSSANKLVLPLENFPAKYSLLIDTEG